MPGDNGTEQAVANMQKIEILYTALTPEKLWGCMSVTPELHELCAARAVDGGLAMRLHGNYVHPTEEGTKLWKQHGYDSPATHFDILYRQYDGDCELMGP